MKRLLAIDAPNLDMTLAALLGGRPAPRQRADLGVLLQWFRDRLAPGEEAEAAVFVNVREDLADKMAPWVLWLVSAGYRVFCKPKLGDSDIDDDLLRYLTGPRPDQLAEAALVSHDARAFLGITQDLAAAGVTVTVLGFAEYAGQFVRADRVGFVDLGDIPGLFAELPPRVSLHRLPPEGRWFEPMAAARTGLAPEHVDLDLG